MATQDLGEIRFDPVSGKKIIRDVRPFDVKYKNLTKTVPLAGWYPIDGGDAIFTQDDLDLYDAAFDELKAIYEKKHSPGILHKAASLL